MQNHLKLKYCSIKSCGYRFFNKFGDNLRNLQFTSVYFLREDHEGLDQLILDNKIPKDQENINIEMFLLKTMH